MSKRLIDVKELSGQISVKPATIYKWASQGRIPCLKLGRLVRFDAAEILEWLRSPDHKMRQNGTCVKWGRNGISNKLNRNRSAT